MLRREVVPNDATIRLTLDLLTLELGRLAVPVMREKIVEVLWVFAQVLTQPRPQGIEVVVLQRTEELSVKAGTFTQRRALEDVPCHGKEDTGGIEHTPDALWQRRDSDHARGQGEHLHSSTHIADDWRKRA